MILIGHLRGDSKSIDETVDILEKHFETKINITEINNIDLEQATEIAFVISK